MSTAAVTARIDAHELESKVQAMYRDVAERPEGKYHFEMGRTLAERLGYPSAELDRIPAQAIASFAGVGHYFHLAVISSGETVVDLGSGSGMDSFLAALKVGKDGNVIGVDMTDAQRLKAERLRDEGGFGNVAFLKGYIDAVPLADHTADVVISNGVFNLAPDKAAVFAEVARLLRPGGRMVIADIVTDLALPESISCNTTLWAACIGGAAQRDDYRAMIEAAGLTVDAVEDNDAYRFISDSALGATRKYGVKSVSLRAVKQPA
jgi:arsenite methyltransferase